jgi:diguanylate cyclase (GGDEF)-like protein
VAIEAAALREILFPDGLPPAPIPALKRPARVLAVHASDNLYTRIRSTAAPRGLGTTRDPTGADIEGAIVDLAERNGDSLIRGYAERHPSVPILALADTASLTDRVLAASAGASLVLPRTGALIDLVIAAESLAKQRRQGRFRILAVDDDPVILAALPLVLASEPVDVTTLGDARQFWATLERTGPDLVVLDLDMPHLGGIELCRIIRTDPRWSTLPVLFLTATTDPAIVDDIFAAGADDYVSKPLVSGEIRARIRNRLDRAALYRRLTDTDPLTGLINRRRLEIDFDRLSALARRHNQPLSLALLDIDHFKRVNDTHGHGIGDLVLRRLADHLTKEYRGEDVVARWGGEEFAILTFGMSAADAGQRLSGILDSIRMTPIDLPEPAQSSLSISFSAGVAQLDHHGDDLHSLTRAADTAMYRAKRWGRGRVLKANDDNTQIPAPQSYSDKQPLRLEPTIQAYYATLVERERLATSGHGRLELIRTQELLTRTLPPAPARVLDVGGGTGVYAQWLAAAGYEVHLIDAVPEHVWEALAESSAFTAAIGDARSLDQPDDSADAVLLLGPLYHLLDREDRLQALREARRVLRPGGILAAAVVSRHSALLAFASRGELDSARRDLALATLAHGRHDPTLSFTTAFFHTPEETVAELQQTGFRDVRVRAIEGPMWPAVKTCTDPLRLDALIESALICARALEDDPAMLAASAHLLTTGRA